MIKKLFLSFCLLLTACSPMASQDEFAQVRVQFADLEADSNLAQATFAAGCFWCTEAAFQEMEGVEEVLSGYVGGEEVDPTYYQVVGHETGHREGVRVYYHPDQVSYEDLLTQLWNTIDPTDDGGQFTDRGFNYTTAIFYANEEERVAADASKAALEESGRFDSPIVTEIVELTSFYPAEDVHQDFYKHSAERYKRFKNGSGRDAFFSN